MVFSSLIFIFFFFPLHLLAYYVLSPRKRNGVLIVSSLIFYAWGGPPYVLLLVGETLVSWLFALGIEHSETHGRRKAYLIGECVVLLGLLAYFKYFSWILGITQTWFDVPVFLPEVLLPIGISFYTFQLLSYVCDVYRGEVPAQPHFTRLLLYSSLFYQCIAGPIVRYETVEKEISRRRATPNDIYVGVRRFCIGLAKKAVLANSCAEVADTLLPIGDASLATQAVAGYWVGMAFYMLQIYLDFSAYSDMAIGMGRIVGFHFLENFNYPYISTSIREFWRRWHISLSSFFRDYVYIPLGGSRCSKVKYIRNMTIVWFLTGLWHGASWNYVCWGLYFLVFLLLERFVIKDRLSRLVGHIYAVLVVYFGWVLFKFENFGELGCVLAGMFGGMGTPFLTLEVQTLIFHNLFLFIVAVIACIPVGRGIRKWLSRRSHRSRGWLMAYQVEEFLVPSVLFVLSAVALAGASYNPFIYFQF